MSGTRPKDALERADLAFVEKYVETLNPGEAYKYSRPDYKGKNATGRGYETLQRPAIIAAMQVRRQQVASQLNVTATEVIKRMMFIGYVDPADMLDAEGRLLPVRSMPKDVRLALASTKILKTEVHVEIVEAEEGQPLKVGITTTEKLIEVKFWDKVKMLNSLAQHLNLFRGGRTRHPLEDMSLEEIRSLADANRAAIAAIEGASASSRKSLLKAVAKSTAAVMAEVAVPKAEPEPKKTNGKGNGKGNGHG